MAHVDYDVWADHVQGLIERHHPTAEAILELGCGTGSLALRLQPRGPYAYLATDDSAEMLRVARRKARGKLIRFRRADFTDFEVDRPADVVLLLYDGMNYLLEEEQVHALLACAHVALRPGGVFLFDQSTPVNSAEEGFEYTGQAADFTFERRSHYDPDTHLHTTTLELRTPEGTLSEAHVQRAYTLAEVRRLVRASAFTEVAAYDGFTADPASHASARVHWVLRRAD